MLALLGEAEAHGAALARRARSCAPRRAATASCSRWAARSRCACEGCGLLINSAGLHAALAAAIARPAAHAVPALRYARGNYFSLAGRAPFSRLIYPVPEPGGLGVHLTLDLGGQARFGPDVEWIGRHRLHGRPAPRRRLLRRSTQILAGLPDGALQPAYAGIRPKLSGPGEPAADFLVQSPASTACRGW
jgi:L-2-hydroxyglutarate oxidase LhgO